MNCKSAVDVKSDVDIEKKMTPSAPNVKDACVCLSGWPGPPLVPGFVCSPEKHDHDGGDGDRINQESDADGLGSRDRK